jgi:hypothetical protein
MTVIQDMEAPQITAERRPPDAATIRNRLVVLLCASAVTLTAVNLVASVKLYSSAERMSELGARLDQMAAFEKRITDKIDLVNVGLQNQFDNLDASIASRFAETSDGIGALEKQLVRTGNAADGGQPAFDTVPASDGIEQAGSKIAAEMGHFPAGGAVTGMSPTYQRIETPEGEVTYRKIR